MHQEIWLEAKASFSDLFSLFSFHKADTCHLFSIAFCYYPSRKCSPRISIDWNLGFFYQCPYSSNSQPPYTIPRVRVEERGAAFLLKGYVINRHRNMT